MSNNELDQLAKDFWEWRFLTQPVISDDIPRVDRPASWDPDWLYETVLAQRQQVEEFEKRWKAIDASSSPISSQVDYRLIGSAIARFRWETDVLRSWQCNPRFYVYQTLGSLFEILLKNKPFDETRSNEVIKCLKRFRRFVEQGIQNLTGHCVRPFAIATLEVIKDFRSQLTTVASELKPLLFKNSADQLDETIGEAIAALEIFTLWLNDNLSTMTEGSACGRDAYVYFLKNVALIPYTPEQLLAMGKQEWERSMTFEAFAHNRAINSPALSIFSDELTQMAAEENDERKFGNSWKTTTS